MVNQFVLDMLQKIDGEHLFVLLLVGGLAGGGMLTGTIVSLAKQLRRYREAKVASELVRDMLARNLSVEQITVLLRAWSESRDPLDQKAIDHVTEARPDAAQVKTPPRKPVAGSYPA